MSAADDFRIERLRRDVRQLVDELLVALVAVLGGEDPPDGQPGDEDFHSGGFLTMPSPPIVEGGDAGGEEANRIAA